MTNEDDIAWQKAVEGAQPVKAVHRVLASTPKKTPKRFLRQTTSVYKNYHHDLELDCAADIDKNTMRRFKREELGVEATLDLHGMTMDKAYEAVKNFVISCFERQKRAVIIVTGKGLAHQSDDIFETKGVLKQCVPEWLKGETLRPMILTYIHPSAKLGGEGALYILLRRKR